MYMYVLPSGFFSLAGPSGTIVLLHTIIYYTSIYPSSGQLWGKVQVCEYDICLIVASLYRA
jgi:hypothetical protein